MDLIVAMYFWYVSIENGLRVESQTRITGFESLAQCEANIDQIRGVIEARASVQPESAGVLCVEEGAGRE
jgi:hypothetical protein